MKKRVVSLFLVAVMLFSMIPSAVFAVNAEPAQLSGSMVADDSTLDAWKKYFGLQTDEQGNPHYSTEYAGAVWSDKTVLTKDEIPAGFPSALTMDEDNFLVALSALASNSEIVGYASIPTDTILVLDMSSSMNSAGAIDDLAVAANNAIKALYAENRNNRVGVVYYSGSDDTMVLMPLDRYSSTSGNYVEHYKASNGRSGIRICSGVKNSAGTTVEAEDTYHSGTFTQDGVYVAMQQLMAADKTVASGVQAGTERMPIIVLMTDGEPTHTTNDFFGSSASLDSLMDAGWISGITESSSQEFLTQLTAAYAKYMLENDPDHRYLEHDLLFYTLGFDVQGTPAVLQPERATTTNSYWTKFLNGTNVTVTDNKVVQGGSSAYTAFRAKLNSTAEEDMRTGTLNKYRYYVDEYFSASGADSLNAAFQAIVEQIILQSRYSPTLVGSAGKNMSGYLTISDEIGEFMEVKNVNGIVLGNTLFTGAVLTKMMQEKVFTATESGWKLQTLDADGWELVDVVTERVGVTQDQAIELLLNAWSDGQLRYTSDTDFSNYISFYADADGKYLGFYDEDPTNDPAPVDGESSVTGAPEGAKYITRAYGFYGPADGSISGSNMLHIVVRVRTEIATGMQEVLVKIPASLIPVLTYLITISGDDLEDPGDITLEIEEEEPIHLLFEVGLHSDITELNVAEKMAAAQYDHDNGDGTYSFYSNRWGSHTGGYEVDYDLPLTHLVADSHFHPSEENERYYFTENTLICVDDQGTPYTGAKPTEGTYYHVRHLFQTVSGAEGAAVKKDIYVPVSAKSLELAQPNGDGTWYIPKDTIRHATERFQVAKTTNATGTLAYSYYPLVESPEHNESFDIYKFHGNNGKLTVAAATGLKLSKTVDADQPDTDTGFEFTVTVGDITGDYTLTDADGAVSTIRFTNGTAKLTLKHGQSVYITGLPAGAAYTVTETPHAGYLATTSASGTLRAGKVDAVQVVNVPRGTGNLAVSKHLTHPLGSSVHIPTPFTVQVTLRDVLGAPITGTLTATHSGDSTLQSVTADQNGSFTVTLKAGETLVVQGLQEGATAAVQELTVSDGYTVGYWESDKYDDGTVTIVKDTATAVVVHNHYQPREVYPVNINVEGEKILDGRQWLESDSFTFQLQKYTADGWVTIGTKTVTGADAEKTFSFNLAEMSGEKFTAVGEYTYQVVELIPDATIPGVTYDRTIHNFTVLVTDQDFDGQLEISSVASEHGHDEDVSYDAAFGWTVHAPFTNVYGVDDNASASVSVDIIKTLDNPSQSTLVSLRGWQFALYAALDDAEPVAGTAVTTDSAGEARFVMNYDKDDVGQSYTYFIKEVNGGKTGVAYSQAAYEVTVQVSDDSQGGMTAAVTAIRKVRGDDGSAADQTLTADQFPTFNNSYDPGQVTVPVTITKALQNAESLNRPLGEDEFTFDLYAVDGTTETLFATGTNQEDGTVLLNKALTYSVVGEYSYRLVERIPADGDKLSGITYDATAYLFHVHVEDENGVLTATVHRDETESEELNFTFTNRYAADAVENSISGTKVLLNPNGTERSLVNGMFTFGLYESDGVTEIDTAVNGVNGVFQFDAQTYTKADTYEYVIREIPGTLGYITYDDDYYRVAVTIADEDFDGKLEVKSVTYEYVAVDGQTAAEGVSAEAAKFTNTYHPAPTSVAFSAVKTLENRAPENGEFRFLVYETGADFAVAAAAQPVRTAVNGAADAAGNNVNFDAITYTKPGTHYYVIREDASYQTKDDVSYDDSVYHVTVVVFDQGDGTLNRRVSYERNGLSVDVVDFFNIWHPPIPGTLTVQKAFSGLPEDRQPKIVVNVTGPNGYNRNVTLDADNNWTVILDDLAHGEYEVKEISAGTVADYQLTGTAVSGKVTFDNSNTTATITVTNTYEERLGTLTVRKDFVGLPDDLRPAIRVTVEGINSGYEQAVTLNAANNWTATLTGLVWDTYTVKEDLSSAQVTNYAVTGSAAQGVTFSADKTTASVTVTNTYDERFGTLTVQKNFVGLPDDLRPAAIHATVTGPNGYSKAITLNAANNWRVALENLAWGEYAVTEDEESGAVANYVLTRAVASDPVSFGLTNTTATLSLTNTYESRFGSLTIEKQFAGDVPADLPGEIKVTVTGPNGYRKDVTLTAANDWSATVTGLAWGEYTVKEDLSSAQVTNYAVTGSAAQGVTFSADKTTASVIVTNTYDERFGTLTVQKNFVGLPDDLRPAAIHATVTGPNGYRQGITLNAANNWRVALENLAWGEYSVTEDEESGAVANYVLTKAVASDPVSFGLTNTTATLSLTNTYESRFGSLTIEKQFAGDVPANLPDEIKVTVTGPNGYRKDVTLTAADNWTAKLENLAWGEYTVTENEESAHVENYALVSSVSGKVSFSADKTTASVIVTNTYDERFGDLTIRKEFAGDVPADLPAEIRATVVSDKGYRKDIVLTAANNWTVHLYDLPQAVYTVTEDEESAKVANYVVTSSVTDSEEFHNGYVSGEIVITNTYDERFGALTIEKQFAGDVPADLPTEIKVTVTGPNGYRKDVTLTAANDWSATVTGLAWGEYTVTENEESAHVENYALVSSVSGKVSFTADKTDGKITVTNTYDERFGSLTIEKEFAGDVPADLPTEIKATVTGPNGYRKDVKLTAANDWSATVTGLAWGEYTVTENEESAHVENYALVSSVSGKVNFTADKTSGKITVTNTYDERFGTLTVRKDFVGLPDDLRPAIRVTVEGINSGYEQAVTLNAANNWTATLTGLVWDTYTVKEDLASAQVTNYAVTGSASQGVTFSADKTTASVTVINTYDERFGTLTVQKNFVGLPDDLRPAAIHATVNGPNGYRQDITLTAANNWTVKLENLVWGEYSVSEDEESGAVANYVLTRAVASDPVSFGLTNTTAALSLTNTYESRFGSLTIEKQFAGDVPTNLPDEIKVTVTGPNGYRQDVTLTAANDWTAKLENLAWGEYTVTENEESAHVENYALVSSVSGKVSFTADKTDGKITVTNTYDERFGDLTIRKEFAGDLPEAKRPQVIQAIVTGPEDYVNVVDLTAENGWTVTLTDLVPGTYCVEENTRSAHVESYWFQVSGAGEVEMAEDETVVVTLTNDYRYIPETGDSFHPVVWVCTATLSLLGIPVLLLKRRKEEECAAE